MFVCIGARIQSKVTSRKAQLCILSKLEYWEYMNMCTQHTRTHTDMAESTDVTTQLHEIEARIYESDCLLDESVLSSSSVLHFLHVP
jgi:hypothetical protein